MTPVGKTSWGHVETVAHPKTQVLWTYISHVHFHYTYCKLKLIILLRTLVIIYEYITSIIRLHRCAYHEILFVVTDVLWSAYVSPYLCWTNNEPYNNGWPDQDAVWDMESQAFKKPCIVLSEVIPVYWMKKGVVLGRASGHSETWQQIIFKISEKTVGGTNLPIGRGTFRKGNTETYPRLIFSSFFTTVAAMRPLATSTVATCCYTYSKVRLIISLFAAATVTEVFVLCRLLGVRGCITNQSSVCILMSVCGLEQKCLHLVTKGSEWLTAAASALWAACSMLVVQRHVTDSSTCPQHNDRHSQIQLLLTSVSTGPEKSWKMKNVSGL